MSMAYAKHVAACKNKGDVLSPSEFTEKKDFGPSLTKQAEAEACDINVIMKRYEQTGLLPEAMEREPHYGDFSDMASFQEACGIVAHANAQFAMLPAETRDYFKNDPARFLDYIDNAGSDEKKKAKLVELGLGAVVEPPKEDPHLTALNEIAANTKRGKASTASKRSDDTE